MEHPQSHPYTIRLDSLKQGAHRFDFRIEDAFFELFDQSLIEQAGVDIGLKLNKTHQLYDLQLAFQGYVMLTCDRCLKGFPLAIDFQHRMVLSSNSSLKPVENEEIVYLAPGTPAIDLSQDFYDLIGLQVPYRKVPQRKIDECEDCGIEVYQYSAGAANTGEEDEIDPRWAKLLDLKNKNA
jgi:uncharacterized metal-binding protein YceD (DUF177 family)